MLVLTPLTAAVVLLFAGALLINIGQLMFISVQGVHLDRFDIMSGVKTKDQTGIDIIYKFVRLWDLSLGLMAGC